MDPATICTFNSPASRAISETDSPSIVSAALASAPRLPRQLKVSGSAISDAPWETAARTSRSARSRLAPLSESALIWIAAAMKDTRYLFRLSVSRNRRIDLRPGIDAAGEIQYLREAITREVHTNLRASHPVVAHHNGLAFRIEFRPSCGNLTHRDIHRAGQRGGGDFPRLAHVKNYRFVAFAQAAL